MNKKAIALGALAVSLVACGKETHVGSESTGTVTQQQFLENVPADTPYIAAAVDPAPLAELLPWLQTLDDAATPTPERIQELLDDPETKPRKRRALALLAELTGHFTPEGLEELGFSSSPRFALYGIGLLPAIRVEIDDARKVGDFLARVGAKSGVESTKKQSNGQDYWTFPSVRHNRTIVMTIQDDRLLAGVTTPDAEELFVSHLLGNAEVTESLPDDQIRATAKDWGFQNYSVGYVDFMRLAETFLNREQQGLNQDVWKLVKKNPREVSDVCRDETLSMVSHVPRFVFGSESWAPANLQLGAGIVIDDDITSQLAATKTGAPLTQMPAAAGVAGFGFNVGQAVQILRTRAQAVSDKPFQCEWYKGVNKGADALASRWSMLPPFFAEIDGGTLLVRDIRKADPESGRKVDLDAALALSTDQPIELFDFVKSFNNDLFELNATPDGTPLMLPAVHGIDRLIAPQIVAHPGAIALTSGDWGATQLDAQSLAAKPAPFIFVNYDAQRIVEQLQIDDSNRPLHHALRGKAEHAIEPTARGIEFRSTYTRDIGE